MDIEELATHSTVHDLDSDIHTSQPRATATNDVAQFALQKNPLIRTMALHHAAICSQFKFVGWPE